LVKNARNGNLFCGFNPAVSPSALKAMRSTIRDLRLRRRTHVSLKDIARVLNPLLRGWIAYYGRYTPSALRPLLRHVNLTLLGWLMRKFKRFKRHKTRTGRFLKQLARKRADLFAH
jgi:RNA-directed DNA polymerase